MVSGIMFDRELTFENGSPTVIEPAATEPTDTYITAVRPRQIINF